MQLSSAMNSPETLKTLQYNPLLYYTYYAQVWVLSLELNTEIQFHEWGQAVLKILIFVLRNIIFALTPKSKLGGFFQIYSFNGNMSVSQTTIF